MPLWPVSPHLAALLSIPPSHPAILLPSSLLCTFLTISYPNPHPPHYRVSSQPVPWQIRRIVSHDDGGRRSRALLVRRRDVVKIKTYTERRAYHYTRPIPVSPDSESTRGELGSFEDAQCSTKTRMVVVVF